MPKSPQTLDPPPESHRRNSSAILSLVQGLGGKAGRGLATFEDYERMVRNHPIKFSAEQVGYRRAQEGEVVRCGNCFHLYRQAGGEQRTTCEIFRPAGGKSVEPTYVCRFGTFDGESYPLYESFAPTAQGRKETP